MKHTMRRGYGAALINLAAWIEFVQPGSNVVKSVRLAFGGMGPAPRLVPKAAETMVGK